MATSVIQLLRRQRSGGSWFEASQGKWFVRPYEKNLYKKGLLEWLKVKDLSSNPVQKKKGCIFTMKHTGWGK
jgi:hypothetical protein